MPLVCRLGRGRQTEPRAEACCQGGTSLGDELDGCCPTSVPRLIFLLTCTLATSQTELRTRVSAMGLRPFDRAATLQITARCSL